MFILIVRSYLEKTRKDYIFPPRLFDLYIIQNLG